ncbi:transposase, partial [Vibrio azureus]|uniref:transposase n=2 Tax=Vibrio azureus TaxID=512649 RepID=UPI001D130516
CSALIKPDTSIKEYNPTIEVTMTKRKNRSYTNDFKREAVALVTEQGYSVTKAAASLGITDKLLYNWKAKFEV